jgi:hypothetical protein
MVAFGVFGVLGFLERGAGTNDWGLLLLQAGTPVLLLLNRDRATIIKSLGIFCIIFATTDAIANIGALAGLWQLASAGGRYGDFGERIARFGGLTGNSLASGFVALVAVAVGASWLRRSRPPFQLIIGILWLFAIVFSVELADARRYLGGIAVTAVLIFMPWGRFVSLPLVSLALGLGGIILTFHAIDPENVQRADLMADGWRDAESHIWLGQGVEYRAAPSGSDFNSLWAAHVTESGLLELAIAYGWVSTALLIISTFLALASKHRELTWYSVLLAVMTGEIAYTGVINGFLGAILFFGSLIHIIFDEAPLTSAFSARSTTSGYVARPARSGGS